MTGPPSLTHRLSLLFAWVSLTVLAAAGIYLHQSLAQRLVDRDTQELNGKIELLRHTLADVHSADAMRSTPYRWLDLVIGHDGLHLAIYDAQRTLLLASSNLPIPERVFRDGIGESSTQAEVVEWTDESGNPYRAAAAWAVLGGSGRDRVLIALSLDVSAEKRLLLQYRASIIAAIIAGTLLATALGSWAARKGLAPLRAIAEAASRITASRLDDRLDLASAPRELQSLAVAYNGMLARLEDSFSRLSGFSSDLAHDLRTPVGNLLGEAQVALSRARANEEYRAVIESSVEELERLERMIESMLFLARADNAQLALRVERVDLRVELERVREYFEPLAQEKSIAISSRSDDVVYADVSLLRRAVSNLVANAIRFASGQGGDVALTSQRTTIGSIELLVANSGPEIPPVERERIFDRFYRTSQGGGDPTTGWGLGLAIVKSIMVLHGGRASVECCAGTTTFRLEFPPPVFLGDS